MLEKHLVETTGSFELVDFSYKSQVLDSTRPSVVAMTTFIQGRVALGQVRVLGELSDESTDEEFVNYWKESEDPALAVDAFLATFGKEAVTEKPATKRSRKGS